MSEFPLNPEQQAAKEAIACNVSVSAGAGSGKTRVLVERFLYILERAQVKNNNQQELDAGNILAITFTRKAAGEMKERVRKGIEARLDDDDRGFWRKQLEALNKAQISTIHGLCSRILRENPVEAQLDPAFQVAEEFASAEFLEDCLDKFLRRELREQNASIERLIAVYGVNGLQRLVISILPFLGDIAAEDNLCKPYLESINSLPKLKEQLCILARDMVLKRKDLVGKTSKAGKTLEFMAEMIEDICAGIKQEPADFTALDKATEGMQARGGIKDYLQAIRELEEIIQNAAVDKAALELLPCWQELLRGLGNYVKEQKLALDLLDYDDLENYTVELLRNNEDVRRKYQERYRYIMVDEFQDTNDRQRQLIYLLCGDDDEKLEGKKLFIVGDPKQSIYRFRGADVSVFARVRREIAASGGKNLLLTKNYRTVDKILLAVNSVFRILMGTDSSKDVFFEELAYHKDGTELPQLLVVEFDKDCGKNKFQVEAEAVALAIEAYHEGKDYEGKQLLAPKVPYGKMAILLRAMTHCDDLASAMQARGIPYEIIDGKGFYECQEVLDILNLLASLHNRYNSLALAGVLRSPYFGLNDESLTKLFLQREDCLWDALQAAVPEDFGQQGEFLSRAAVILRRLRQQASVLALPELWQWVWRELAVDAVLPAQEHGANKLANVQKLRQLALEYSQQHNGTLADWLDYVQRLRAAEARETTANLETSDAVKIMTIHKSKGLEFGTVFLPYLNSNNQADTSGIKYLRGIGLGIKAPDANGVLQNTNVLRNVKDEDKRLELEERKRQLYVAMTRAEERLIMTGIAIGKKDKTLDELSWLKQLLQIYENDSVVEINAFDVEKHDAIELGVAERKEVTQEQLKAITPLPSYLPNGKREFTPSSLQTYLYCQRQYFYQYVMGLPPLEQEDDEQSEASEDAVLTAQDQGQGKAFESKKQAYDSTISAKDLGSLIHRALELYKGDVDAALTKATQEIVPFYQGTKARRMLEKYLASDLYQRIPKDGLREQAFTLYAPNDIVISGIIDCLGINSDGSMVLVDYKTGKPPIKGEVKEGYAYQLAIYERVVRQRWANSKAVKQPLQLTSELHFLQNNTLWNLEAEQASGRDYYAEALALCEAISKKRTEEEFSCLEQKCISKEQKINLASYCKAEEENNAKNIAKGVAACDYCPYNYVCNHK